MFYSFTKKPFADKILFGPEHSFQKDFVIANCNYSKNNNTNEAIYEITKHQNISILDIGCGTGSYIEKFIEDGHIVVGIDGFWIYKKFGIHPWAKYPNNFLNADLEQPLIISFEENCQYNLENPQPFLFDIVTTCEFMEHLRPGGVNQCCETIAKHLKKNGVFIAEISYAQDGGHLSINSKDWWIDKFKEYCLIQSSEIENIMYNRYYRNLHSSYHFCFVKI